MGCHIYIRNKVTKDNVECPWYRTGSLYGKKITTKVEFKVFLIECQKRDNEAIESAQGLLDDMRSGDVLAKGMASKLIVDRFHNNAGFMNKSAETDVDTACIYIQEFEVNRLKEFAMDDEMMKEFLDSFDEEKHIVELT